MYHCNFLYVNIIPAVCKYFQLFLLTSYFFCTFLDRFFFHKSVLTSCDSCAPRGMSMSMEYVIFWKTYSNSMCEIHYVSNFCMFFILTNCNTILVTNSKTRSYSTTMSFPDRRNNTLVWLLRNL